MRVTTRHIGILLLVISFILLFLLLSLTYQLNKVKGGEECLCPGMGETCPMETRWPIQTYFGIVFIVVLCSIGLALFFMPRREQAGIKKERAKNLKGLGGEEKKVYEAVISSEGALFQSELTEKTGFSKVKVTRLLDRLEGKGLIERRRGMTNVVILKT